MGDHVANLIALGFVAILAIAVLAMEYLDYRAEVEFNREHHVK